MTQTVNAEVAGTTRKFLESGLRNLCATGQQRPFPALTMLDAMLQIDAALRAWLATHHASPLDALMLGLSALGRGGMVWFALAIALALLRRVRTAAVWRVALALGLAGLATEAGVKPAVGRVRPFEAVMDVRVIGERPATSSFPSGHAAAAFAGALSLGRAWPGGRLLLWTLAALIAFSRVYVGVHYPLDVIGGALLGLACAWFALGGRLPRPPDGVVRTAQSL